MKRGEVVAIVLTDWEKPVQGDTVKRGEGVAIVLTDWEKPVQGDTVKRGEGVAIVLTDWEKPVQGDTVKRGKGVAIVRTDWAIDAWKAAGRQWKARSSRAVSACLQLGGRSRDKLHIVSCYAPTRVLAGKRRIHFFDEMNSILSSVPAGEKYIVLGDFNACVGSRQVVGDQWSKVRGPHGCGLTNNAGKEQLLSLNPADNWVGNTWFRKKEIHRVTWQHPKSKQWSCID